MMMEFEETAVTGSIVRRSPAKAPAARKPATSRPRRRSLRLELPLFHREVNLCLRSGG